VQPVIDPAAVGLFRYDGTVSQFGEPRLGGHYGVEDFS
jgi:hypothetical protein